MNYLIGFLLLISVWVGLVACEPEEEVVIRNPKADLEFSADSVLFDTVFVQTGSVTRRLTVYNFNKNAVEVDEIRLGNATNSPYTLIIDGVDGPVARQVRIRGQDSLYVLVKVKIKPGNSNAPFLVQDAISFKINNKVQDVKLVAYGQEAYFYRDVELPCDATWAADKPHVIYGNIKVKDGCSLTIQKGARIYAHKDAALQISGTLRIEGTSDQRVIFDGDRLEPFYNEVPGQWSGIQFLGKSKNNTIRYADIRNANVAILANNSDRNANTYDVVLENCIIKNMFTAGILSYTADVEVINSLITNCGQYAVAGLGGGTYSFKYCTIANYTPEFKRETPSFYFTDQEKQVTYRLKIAMVNSIIWAGKRGLRLTEEMHLQHTGGTTLDTTFTHNILQTERYKNVLNKTNLINQEPGFKNTPETTRNYKYDYSLVAGAKANGAAKPLPDIQKDIKDVVRDATAPDIGTYELP